MLSSLAFAAAVASEPLRINLTEVQAGGSNSHIVSGQPVTFEWPATMGGTKSTLDFDGETWSISDAGAVIGRFEIDGAWKDIEAGYVRATSVHTDATPVWRVKVFALTKGEILNRGEVLRRRTMTLEKAELQHLNESLARFAATVESQAKGKLKVHVDVEVDADEVWQESSPNAVPFDEAWLKSYLGPRVNGHDFQADDRIYRGPWDSVFVVHAGLILDAVRTTVNGNPATGLPFFSHGPFKGSANLTSHLLKSWASDFTFAARKHGYPIPETVAVTVGAEGLIDPLSIASTDMFSEVRNTVEPNYDLWLKRIGARPAVAPKNWAEVSDKPMDKLPFLTKAELDSIAGAEVSINSGSGQTLAFVPQFSVPALTSTTSFDIRFVAGTESASWFPAGDKAVVFVALDRSQLFGKNFKAELDAKVHGVMDFGGTLVTVWTTKPIKTGTQEVELLGRAAVLPAAGSAKTAAPQVVFSGAETGLATTGAFQAKSEQDAQRGSVLDLTTVGQIRLGSVTVWDAEKSGLNLDAKTRQKVSFWVKSSYTEPIVLRFHSATPSWKGAAVRIFGDWPVAEEADVEPMISLPTPLNGEWQKVEFDLRSVAPVGPQMQVSKITLESDRGALLWGTRLSRPPSVQFAELSMVEATGTPPATPQPTPVAPDAASQDSEARALWAAQAGNDEASVAQLIELIKDKDSTVRLNAISAFQRMQAPKAESALFDALNTLDPRLAEAGLRALHFQKTESGWAAIIRALRVGPTDAHKRVAAELLIDRKDPLIAGTISGVYVSRSWNARLQGVRALAAIPGREASLLTVVFLQEVDPAVRLVVSELANMEIDQICRRVLYSAVNDSSEVVRAASYKRLLTASLPNFVSEGYKGVRDESPYVRLSLLEHFKQNPKEEHRGALRIAVVDLDPRVRAAALDAFAVLPGLVAIEEIQNVVNDADPRVKASFEALKKAKGLP